MIQRDPTLIVRQLTAPMAAMLIDIADGKPKEYALKRQGFALHRDGLVFVNELGARHLTDLGHAVRKCLLEKRK